LKNILSFRLAYRIPRHRRRRLIWTRLARWNDVTIIGERKVADFINRCQQILQISIFRLLQRFRVLVHVFETYTMRTFQQTYQDVGFTAI